MMVDNPTFLEALKVIAFVFGGGSGGAALVAYLNRKPAPPPAPLVAPPQPHESAWLIQSIIEIKLEIEGIRRAVDTQTHAVQTMSVQVNTIGELVKRLGAWLRRKLKVAD